MTKTASIYGEDEKFTSPEGEFSFKVNLTDDCISIDKCLLHGEGFGVAHVIHKDFTRYSDSPELNWDCSFNGNIEFDDFKLSGMYIPSKKALYLVFFHPDDEFSSILGTHPKKCTEPYYYGQSDVIFTEFYFPTSKFNSIEDFELMLEGVPNRVYKFDAGEVSKSGRVLDSQPTSQPKVDTLYEITIYEECNPPNSQQQLTNGGHLRTSSARNNQCPLVANAGPDQKVKGEKEPELITLDGSASKGSSIKYEWTKTKGPDSIVLDDAASVSPSFTFPASEEFEEKEIVTFELKVTDKDKKTDTDTIDVKRPRYPIIVIPGVAGTRITQVMDDGKNEQYRFHYDTKRGVTMEFLR